MLGPKEAQGSHLKSPFLGVAHYQIPRDKTKAHSIGGAGGPRILIRAAD
jgi:hypothetical protein